MGGVELQDETRALPMHPMEPTIHGVASAVRRLSRNTCGSPAAVLRSEIRKASAPPYRFSLRAILFYLCLNILKHCAVRPCSPCHSAGPLPSGCSGRPLSFKHSPAILVISGNAKPSVTFTCIYRVVRGNAKRARRRGRSGRLERNALWRS